MYICIRTSIYIYIYTHTYTYMSYVYGYIYIYIYDSADPICPRRSPVAPSEALARVGYRREI